MQYLNALGMDEITYRGSEEREKNKNQEKAVRNFNIQSSDTEGERLKRENRDQKELEGHPRSMFC